MIIKRLSLQPEKIVVRIEARIATINGRRRILTSNTLPNVKTAAEAEANTALVRAVLRAHQCNDYLLSGKYKSISELADKEQINRTHLGRLMRLNLLSPQVKEAILNNMLTDPPKLITLFQGFPLLWEEQKKYFGLS